MILITLFCVFSVHAVLFETLEGVSYQNNGDNVGLQYLSMMGGAPIVIAG